MPVPFKLGEHEISWQKNGLYPLGFTPMEIKPEDNIDCGIESVFVLAVERRDDIFKWQWRAMLIIRGSWSTVEYHGLKDSRDEAEAEGVKWLQEKYQKYIIEKVPLNN